MLNWYIPWMIGDNPHPYVPQFFEKREFACKCGCGFADISVELVKKLDMIRSLHGRPINITSGCRCRTHNGKVGGTLRSQHLNGTAVDISAEIPEYYDLLQYAFSQGITGIGIGVGFLHFDVRKEDGVVWLYPTK